MVKCTWPHTICSWMIDRDVLCENDQVWYKRELRELTGKVTRDGIQCGHCNEVISPSAFQLHAGATQPHHPYKHIFKKQPWKNKGKSSIMLSLVQCQINASENLSQLESKGISNKDLDANVDPNDDSCRICGEGGDLICCDGCPSSFHPTCLGIEVADGDWYCKMCSCKFCGLFSPSRNVNVSTKLLLCRQCNQNYHQECVPKPKPKPNASCKNDTLFCHSNCERVSKRLQQLLGSNNQLEGGLRWSLIHHFDEPLDPKYQWLKVNCNSKTSIALEVVNEFFSQIIDKRSGIDMVRNVVYNISSNTSQLSCSGFYNFILEEGDELISVASVRINVWMKFAEMPFVVTCEDYTGRRRFPLLFKEILSVLRKFKIKLLIVPSASSREKFWIKNLGFRHVNSSRATQIRSVNILSFPGTVMLEKLLHDNDSDAEHASEGDASC